MRDWWRTYFGEDFFQLHIDLFPEADSRGEVAGMLEMLGLPAGARMLDVPCGWGRHTVLLAEAGFEVTGADLSPALLSHAARGEGLAGFVAADLRELPFADGAFDAAINVFTSLGLFLDDRADLTALSEIRRVLKPNGQFLLETMHRDEVICDFAARDGWTLPNGIEVRVRRRFDPVTGISHERLRWRRGTVTGEKRHALKLRTATEIDRLLREAGFVDVRYYGDWQARRFSHRSPHLIAVASNGGAPHSPVAVQSPKH
jgi:ubiquinone/menaquinone biosynthesis C-methylase UbiE